MSCYRGEVRGDVSNQGRGSCGGSGGNVAGASSGGCVKDTVRRILDAQRDVSAGGLHDCLSSCDRSIDDLLSPGRERRGRHTTIPFMLTCKDGCSTFYGSGFCGYGGNLGQSGHFECVESPIFKVSGFVQGSDSCVKLELLVPVDFHDHDHGHDHGSGGCCGSVCKSLGNRHFKNLRRTGVCITVDLNCFCGISCLPATTPREFE